jgi:hypothetical protein
METKDTKTRNGITSYQRALRSGFIQKPRAHTLARHGLTEFWTQMVEAKKALDTSAASTTIEEPNVANEPKAASKRKAREATRAASEAAPKKRVRSKHLDLVGTPV